MKQLMSQWDGPSLYFTADLPHILSRSWIQECWQKARAAQNNESQILLILDEVQRVPDWSIEVKALFDDERARKNPIKIVLLGSASWLLAQGLNETLAGRFEYIRASHWSLAESIQCFDWNLDKFLKFGGYPAASEFITDIDRWQDYIRDSIIEPMLSRDILPLKNIGKPALFRQTLALSMSYPAQELSLSKMLGQLQEKGNTTTIKGYLELLESGFVIKSLEKFSTRHFTKKSSIPKILPLCPALIHAYTDPMRIESDKEWLGRVFEAAVGAMLHHAFPNLYYWREANAEVDFVAEYRDQIIAVEVKSGRKKSEKGLHSFKQQFPKSKTIILDLDSGTQFLSSQSPKDFILHLI